MRYVLWPKVLGPMPDWALMQFGARSGGGLGAAACLGLVETPAQKNTELDCGLEYSTWLQ